MRCAAIVEEIGSCDRSLGRIQLAGRNFSVDVDERLLIEAPDPFDRAEISSVFGAQIVQMLDLDVAVGLIGDAVLCKAI